MEAAGAGGIDPDAAEAAALAHDLGHPPFGHVAEEELDQCARKAGLDDGFNGNAQSFRIVTKLAIGDPVESGVPFQGLNLTRATLNGVLKYPWLYGTNPMEHKKWGAYRTEQKEFEWARSGTRFGRFTKSLEAEIMDWADDITYAVHDMVDFFCAGQIPLDRLADEKDPVERKLFFDSVFSTRSDLAAEREALETALKEVLQYCPIDRRYTGRSEQRLALWQFMTVLIGRYVNAIRIAKQPSEGGALVEIEQYARNEIAMLKQLIWPYVILNNDLSTVQHGQRRMIRTVFRTLLVASRSRQAWKLFPVGFREELEAANDPQIRARVVTDYVASMTEKELERVFRTLRGRT
jgi:dGTPase